jgi:hypothetical protein
MSKKLIYLVYFILVLALIGTNVVFGDTVWEGRIEDELDDVEQEPSGNMYVDSSDLELPDGQVIGLRYEKVYIPQGATINKAYIEFTVDEIEGPLPANLIIDGELNPNPRAFESVDNNVSTRARTTAKVVWQPEDWPVVGETKQTSDISAVIEEIVNQDGWSSGGALVIILYDDPDNPSIGFRTAEAGPGDDSALLHIEWSIGEAKRPNPADGQTEVSRDVILNWQPGVFAPPVNGHRIYLSESFNDVNDGIGGVTQSADSYAPPERLDFGTTYYWRVDEVNAPPDSTVYRGKVWSFTTEFLAYPIENISVTASSTGQEDMGPENTINGSGLDTNDLHSIDSMDMWLSGDEPLGAWIEYEFDKVYKPHEMWIWNSNQMVESLVGFGFKDVTVEYSLNGVDYSVLGTTHEFARAPGAYEYAHNTTVDFGGVGAKYVRLTANSNWEGLLGLYGLSEVRFLYIPVGAQKPNPVSGATGVDLDVVLGWKAGREAVTHDVYFSDDEQAVIDGTASVETVTETSYGPLSLDLGKTYYWKVHEVNESEAITTWESNLWSFTTIDFLVVDDMESYNDINEGEEGSNRIYLAWIDGYENPAVNGSTVGHLDPPIAERTIVHSGSQSMPFAYNNAVGKSEATLTLTSNRDWTVKGVSSLSIWHQGDAANSAETMYVMLNGSVSVDNDDPAAAQAATWTEWKIDLQVFADQGVDLTNVDSITIGLRSVTSGSGMLYFDDIRLYPPAP